MVSRKGSLLEKTIYNIFTALNFETQINVKIKGYEIDVLAIRNGFRIVCECKQYEKGNLTIRNLIHQWHDKNDELNADRILLVLYGLNIKQSDHQLAESRGIFLWGEHEVEYYQSLVAKDKKEAERVILNDLNIASDEGHLYPYAEQYKIPILTYLLSGKSLKDYDKNIIFGKLVENFKLTLQNALNTDPELDNFDDRAAFAELFSLAESKSIDNIKMWSELKKIIKNNNELFPSHKTKKCLLNTMKEIEEIYHISYQYFNETNQRKLNEKIIITALQLVEYQPYTYLTLMSEFDYQKNVKIAYIEDDVDSSPFFHIQFSEMAVPSDLRNKLEWFFKEKIDVITDDKNHKWVQICCETVHEAKKNIDIVLYKILKTDESTLIVAEEYYKKKSLYWLGINGLMSLIGLMLLFFKVNFLGVLLLFVFGIASIMEFSKFDPSELKKHWQRLLSDKHKTD